jgi:anthraniloyl-CoA monooxygenase
MDLACVGEDPAGLYLAIAVKSRRPNYIVRIIPSRSPSDEDRPQIICNRLKPELDLSDRGLQSEILLCADSVTETSLRRGRDQVLISDQNHRIVSNRALTERLKQLALLAGCRFEPACSLESAPNAGTIIAADGPSGSICVAHADEFGISADTSNVVHAAFIAETKTRRLSEAFERVDGEIFHAFFYPEGDSRTVAIVETTVKALHEAGLDPKDPSAAAEYLSDLFRPDLNNSPLLSRSENWRPFTTYKSKRWRVRDILLVGSAAYTTHFSVNLAMRSQLEDADALAVALTASDPEQAIAKALSARQPKADSLLRAAKEGLTWCEHIDRYIDMPFSQFAFSCLTRSMRSNHTLWKGWAPQIVHDVEELIAGPSASPDKAPPPPMMTPFQLRSLRLPNRIAVSPMCMYSADDGTVNDFHLVHLGSRAIGGAGLVITEMTDVSPEGRISLHCAGMYAPQHVAAWRRIVDFIHGRSEAKVAIQLGHAGRKGSLTRSWEGHRTLPPEIGWTVLAPSAIPFGDDRPAPCEMTRADMVRVKDAFVQATEMSHEAGFDMIELHMAHGYLLSSFISPLSNRRGDQYGGELNNRLRYPLEILGAVRRTWPEEKPLCVRISAFDWIEGGTTVEDAIIISRALSETGCDIVSVSTGGITQERRPMIGRLYQATFSDQIRNELRIPTMAVGGIASYGDANTLVAAGRADICALARGYLYDPYFVRHAARRQGYSDLKWPNEYRGADQLPILDC